VSRVRLGVVLLVPEPAATAVDGLRRAFSDPALEHVAPHITLVAPVNVRREDLAEGLRVLRDAAAEIGPLDLVIGPVTTFEGEEHVAYLAVGGDDRSVAALARLQVHAFRPPFERRVDHGFVPHVTLTQGIGEDRLLSVVAAASGWKGERVRIDALHLLEERHPPEGKRWTPIADIALGPRVVVGRGGLELELTPSDVVDPEAAAAAGSPGDEPDRPEVAVPDGARSLVVAARRERRVVGLARGWTTQAPTSELVDVWVASDQMDDVHQHLWAAWHDAAARRDG
jgi:2'-5' RNA ligase